MKNKFKKILRMIGFHGRILLRGFYRMAYGSMLAISTAMAIYGYAMIPSEGGYVAVCDYLISTGLVCVAIVGLYLMGGGYPKGTKR